MGLLIDDYPLYGGLARINGIEGKVRDITTSKDSQSGRYFLNYVVKLSATSIDLPDAGGQKYFDEPVTGDVWAIAYEDYKAQLTAEGATYTDN